MLGDLDTSEMVEFPLTFTFTYDKDSQFGQALDELSDEERLNFARGYIAQRMAATVENSNEFMEDYIIGLRPVEGM